LKVLITAFPLSFLACIFYGGKREEQANPPPSIRFPLDAHELTASILTSDLTPFTNRSVPTSRPSYPPMTILFPAPNPPILSVFSSSDTFPSPLWSQHTDPLLPAESIILPLLSDVSSHPRDPVPDETTLVHCHSPSSTAAVASIDSPSTSSSQPLKGLLTHPVVHIQSPSIKTTYLRCPPSSPSSATRSELGVELDWLHLQLRRLGGRRELVVEVGIKDGRGIEGRVRMGSFIVRSNQLASGVFIL
jgi:hypothetical protein